MGRVFLRGDKWYLRWKDAQGRRQSKVSAASTKKQAQLLVSELELQADRQRKGLEAQPVKTLKTMAELCDWWLENRCSPNGRAREASRLGVHVKGTALGDVPVSTVTTALLQAHFDKIQKAHKMSAPSRNRVRAVLHSIFAQAAGAGLWVGANPVKGVRRVEEAEREDPVTLRAEEVPLVLAQVPEDWRGFFATAVYWGLRKGEICGLKRSDIDFDAGSARICRSYGNPTVKGKKKATLPIPEPLLPFLKDAVARSPSVWVFPGPDGEMRKENCDPQKILRTALALAGLVDGYLHVCRRCAARGTPHEERHAHHHTGRCPKCTMRLWPKVVHRDMVFHSLRHTTATLLLRSGVPPQHVQKILRHAQITTTIGMYGHLDVEDLREALEKVAPLSEEQQRQLAVNSPGNPGPTGGQMQSDVREAKQPKAGNTKHAAGLGECARPDSNGRPSDSKSDADSSRGYDNRSNGSTSLPEASRTLSHRHPRLSGKGRGSGPHGGQAGGLRLVPAKSSRLLTVQEVAERLRVSTSSVYKLCESGRLRHSRVIASIRVAEDDLEDFLAGGGDA